MKTFFHISATRLPRLSISLDRLNSWEKANGINLIEMQYITEELCSESADSLVSTETEECEKHGHWSKLPSLPLENIYSFLSRVDQVNMSLVCHK
ncbi:hypothetical protein AVEN_46560-1 [Araneus ventricosus]|uniref:F-box domain-containing protein n=1 Tax=Araneus ventricosus TaxID=182803 RepID=A0A4Y2TDR7_ARAVE|nr:hypothetical protein AVEN_46560-1 [Araneus ventricosus]